MSKESYARGFCKAAEAAGVDPVALAKYAQSGLNGVGPLRSTLKSMTPEVVLGRIRANADRVRKETNWLLDGNPVGGKPWGASHSYVDDGLYPVVVPRAKMPNMSGITSSSAKAAPAAARAERISRIAKLFGRK